MKVACIKDMVIFKKVLGIGMTPPPPCWEKFRNNIVIFFLEYTPYFVCESQVLKKIFDGRWLHTPTQSQLSNSPPAGLQQKDKKEKEKTSGKKQDNKKQAHKAR